MSDNKNKPLIQDAARAEIEKTIVAAVEGIASANGGAENGYEVVEVKFFKEYGKFNVTVFIWSRDGVSLDDCEAVHGAVSDVLDKLEDLFPTDYILNVSSSGLDRAVVTDDDFRRAMDTEIEVIIEKEKTHGHLISFDTDSFVIKTGGKSPQNKTFQRNKDKISVQPYIRF